jgi:hypothetical protein
VTFDTLDASSSFEVGAVENTFLTTPRPFSTRFDDDVIKRWIERERATESPTLTSNGHDISTVVRNTAPADLGVVRYPTPTRQLPREEVLQEWEGQVQEVGERVFSARLVDLTAGEKEETEESDLPIDDLVEADRGLLVPGAVFRWIIGYRWSNGEKERFTRVVIRRLPIWTEQEIKAADREAAELHRALFGNEGWGAAERGSD